MRWLLLLTACLGGSKPDDTAPDSGDTAPDSGDSGLQCAPAGVYGDPEWSLEVAGDCSATLLGFCGTGAIAALNIDDAGAFSVEVSWDWQGGGPSGGSAIASFVGGVVDGAVSGTLSWDQQSRTVQATLGETPGSGLGVDQCPLD